MASPRTRVELYFGSRFDRPPAATRFAPGQVLLAAAPPPGPVLAAPLEQGVHVASAIRPDRRVVLHALNARGTDVFTAGERTSTGRRWGDLARGAFAVLAEDLPRLAGFDLAVFGDLPEGRALGASSAYLVAILGAVGDVLGEPFPAPVLARIAVRVERDRTGRVVRPAEPYVAASGRPGEALLVDAEARTHETFALPGGGAPRLPPSRLPPPPPDPAPLVAALARGEAAEVGALLRARGVAVGG